MRRARWLGVAAACCAACAGAVPEPTTPAQASPKPAAEDPSAEAGAASWREREDLLALRMRTLAAAMARAGWQVRAPAWEGFLPAGARAAFPVRVPVGRCRTLVAVGAPGIADLDAALYSADGTALAQDAGSDARPTLSICAEQAPREVYYVLNAYQGAGAYLALAFDGAPQALGAVRALLGEGRVQAPAQDGPRDDPDLAGLLRVLVRRGFEPLGADATFSLEGGEALRLALAVEPGRCYAAVVTRGAGLARLELTIHDEAGEQVARGAPAGTFLGTQFCASLGGAYTVAVRAVEGAGVVRVKRFAAPSRVVGGERGLWLGERRPREPAAASLEERLQAQRALLRSLGYRSLRVLARGPLHTGDAAQRGLRLRDGGCTLLAMVAGPGLRAGALRVVDRDGGVLGSAEAQGPVVYLHLCDLSGRAAVQWAGRAGFGEFALLSLRAGPRVLASVQDVPRDVRAAALDAALRLGAGGWRLSETAPVGVFEAGGADCLPTAAAAGCVADARYRVKRDRCLRLEPLALPKTAVLELAAKGMPLASARGRGVPRCLHDGTVAARLRVPSAERGRWRVLRFERPRRGGATAGQSGEASAPGTSSPPQPSAAPPSSASSRARPSSEAR